MARKVIDRRNKATGFYGNDYLKFIKSQINCINLGRVAKYDKKEHTCEVQLLPLQSDGEKRAMLIEVIVPATIYNVDDLKMITDKVNELVSAVNSEHGKGIKPLKPKELYDKHPTFKVGSIVTVGFFDREIDNFKGKSNYKIETDRMHSLNDAVVLGVVTS